MADWQPIETAPKDGTWIMIASMPLPRGNVQPYDIARFDPFTMKQYVERSDGAFDRVEKTIFEFGECHNPTHWQPLPAPPKATD